MASDMKPFPQHPLFLKPIALILLIGMSGLGQQADLPILTLDQAIEQALNGNSSLKNANLETSRAARDLAANRTKRFASLQVTAYGDQLLTRPSLTFAQGSLGNYPATGPIPGADQKIEVARKPVGIVVASVSQPLTTQYKIHMQLKALELSGMATREDERKQRLETIDKVRRAYYDVAKAQSELDSAKASLPYYQESKRLASENLRRETVLESELLQADVQLVKTENAVNEDSDQLAAALEKLNDLLGRDIRMQFRVADVKDVDAGATPPEALEARALENRPDIRKAKLQVRESEYNSRAKKAEYIPDVSLGVNYITTTNFGSTLPSNITAAGLQLSWEPWDWGRRRQELAGKRLQEEEARVAVDATERSALMEVRNAWRQVESARRQLTLSQASQRQARQKLQETQAQIKVEKVLRDSLFSAQSALASADGQYQQALAAFWSARADLKKATGEE
jgi:outer membrane protein TolC